MESISQQLDIIIVLLFLIHTAADFYFQTDALASAKKSDFFAVIKHTTFYWICSFIGVLLFFPVSSEALILAFWIGLTHASIDICKFFLAWNAPGEKIDPQKSTHMDRIFFIDQFCHLITLFLIWYYYARTIAPYPYVTLQWLNLPYLPATIILGVLIVLKPASLIISKSGVLPPKGNSESLDHESGNGQKIGYLERLIVLAILMYGDFSAIAFVIAAKSIARFSKETSGITVEYYIIGTLFSIVTAIFIAIALGLCTFSVR